jgi:hypothetical protein
MMLVLSAPGKQYSEQSGFGVPHFSRPLREVGLLDGKGSAVADTLR